MIVENSRVFHQQMMKLIILHTIIVFKIKLCQQCMIKYNNVIIYYFPSNNLMLENKTTNMLYFVFGFFGKGISIVMKTESQLFNFCAHKI